jgi:hypothetical protein
MAWMLVIAGAAWAIWYFRDAWGDWWRERRTTGGDSDDHADAPAEPPLPFSSFTDPFALGRANQMPPRDVIQYTFAAVEAWARERGAGRDAGQTPLEFTRQLGQRWRPLAPDATHLGQLYNQAAYAPHSLTSRELQPLARLWKELQAR